MRNVVSVGGLHASILTLFLTLSHAQAVDLYVSTEGSDSNPGTPAEPLRTITRAYALASAGTTIIVLPGTYTDYTSGWGIRLNKSGTIDNPIVLKSQVRGGALIDGENGSDRHHCFYIQGSYHVIDGFDIKNGPNGGITIYGHGNRILNNEIHHNGNLASTDSYGKDGIYSAKGTRDNYYEGNYIHDNGRTGSNLDHGLYLCGQNETIINNILFRNASSGLQVAGGGTVRNMRIYNNVMAYNKDGIILWLTLDGVDIKNNIIYRNSRHGIHSYDAHGGGVVLEANLFYANAAGDHDFTFGRSDYSYTLGTTLYTEPLFVDATSESFDPHLSADSPAIGAGVNLYSVFATDCDGAERPASGSWDLGALVFSSAPEEPPTMEIQARDGSLQVRWPGRCGDYILQSKPISAPSEAWCDTADTPVLNNERRMVSLPVSEGGRLFRLRRAP